MMARPHMTYLLLIGATPSGERDVRGETAKPRPCRTTSWDLTPCSPIEHRPALPFYLLATAVSSSPERMSSVRGRGFANRSQRLTSVMHAGGRQKRSVLVLVLD